MDLVNNPDTNPAETLSQRERIIAELAVWWGDRLICRTREEPKLQELLGLLGIGRYGNVALVTRLSHIYLHHVGDLGDDIAHTYLQDGPSALELAFSETGHVVA